MSDWLRVGGRQPGFSCLLVGWVLLQLGDAVVVAVGAAGVSVCLLPGWEELGEGPTARSDVDGVIVGGNVNGVVDAAGATGCSVGMLWDERGGELVVEVRGGRWRCELAVEVQRGVTDGVAPFVVWTGLVFEGDHDAPYGSFWCAGEDRDGVDADISFARSMGVSLMS